MERRDFLKTMGVVGATSLLGKKANATGTNPQDAPGILVDTNRCVGCRTCEEACAEANGLPEIDWDIEISPDRKTSPTQWTVIQSAKNGEEIYVKKQCMHCISPACASACPTAAMHKTPEGAVVWDEDKCMGCRFCMISCPFDIPKFEYNKAIPNIEKCKMCFDRLKEGEEPACTENCPEEAIIFGKRTELINEGRRRILDDPDSYINHIYGENEVGGTSWMYLSSIPFEELGFRTDLGTTAYPEYTKDFLYAVPFILTLWPPFLLALNKATQKENEGTERESSDE